MWKVSLRNLIGHKMRLVTTGLAVVIGVAFLSGTLVLKDTMKRTFDDIFASAYQNTDALVRAKGEFDDPSGFGVARGRIDASLLDVVAKTQGVAAAQGDVYGYAQLVDKTGEPVGQPQNGPPTVGENWFENDELNPWKIIAGRPPAADDEMVIDSNSAEVTGYKVGDTAKVLVMGPPQTLRIAGIAKFGEAGSTGGATWVLFTPAAAERFVGQPGKYDAIAVVGRDGVSQGDLVRRLRTVLPDGTEAVSGATITKENQDAVQQGMSVFNTFMLAFAFVALFVGFFIVFNTFFITVAQRTRENALLRAIGASKPQVLVSVITEAIAVGIVASILGVVAGVGVAAGLKALLVALGFDLPVTGLVFTSTTALWGMVAGLVVTVLASISPARKAGKVPPVAAMHELSATSTGYGSKERIFVGAFILLLGGGALFYGLFGQPGNALAIVGLAAVLVFVGFTVLGRTVALPLSRLIGWPIPRLRGIAGLLARENAMRNPKRTAATASALMIGVGLVSFITIFAASTKASISDVIDKQFLGDFAVTSPAMAGTGGLDPALAARLNQLPEVDVAGAIRVRAAEVDGTPTQLMAGDAGAFDVFDVKPVQGKPADLGADQIAVFEDVAKEKGLSIGDKLPVVFPQTGRQELTVAMIYGENMPAGDFILGVAAFEKNVPEKFDFQVFVRKAADVPAATAKTAVKRVVDEYPGAKLLDQTGYKQEQGRFVDQMLGLIYALLALAIVIALLGIGNTLALSILERIRELGVLRAVGMTRPQLRSCVRWESVIIAVQGTAIGLLVGVLFGWALVRALADEGITTFALPYTSLVVVVLLGALAGVAASILPARRAARIDVLRAVVSD
jgi:putative ABC transport system permease protein